MGTEEITHRLRRVEGQVRGLQRMVEDERDCDAILTQLFAARAALDRVGLLVVERFIGACLATPDPESAPQRVGRVLNLVLSHYSVTDAETDTIRTLNPIEEELENGKANDGD